MEKFVLEKNDRIYIYRGILQQKPTFFHLSLQKRRVENNQSINFSSDTFQYDGTFSDRFWWWDKWVVERLVSYKV